MWSKKKPDLEQRLLVPLEQMMEYIRFFTPGDYRIHAMIVWSEESDDKDALWELYAKRKESRYESDLITPEGNLVKDLPYAHNCHELGHTSLKIIVDKEFFAEKPRDWHWVNFWFESKPADQCQFRRRRFLAYSVQLILVSIYYFLKSLISLLVAVFNGPLLLRPRVNWQAVIKPWRFNPDDVCKNCESPKNSQPLVSDSSYPTGYCYRFRNPDNSFPNKRIHA